MKRCRNVIVLGIILVVASLASGPRMILAAPIEVGGPETGQTALEFVAKIEQRGFDFTFYGYLTHVDGVDTADLFTDADPLARTEATARFTISGTATGTSRTIVENLFVVDSDGTMTFHFNEAAGASFDTPESFFAGAEIATASIRFHNVLNVQAPDSGLTTGTAALTQETATPFTLNGQEYALGHPGLLTRLFATGQGTRLEPTQPQVVLVIAGDVQVVGDQAAS